MAGLLVRTFLLSPSPHVVFAKVTEEKKSAARSPFTTLAHKITPGNAFPGKVTEKKQ